jgi:hypothetical protein
MIHIHTVGDLKAGDVVHHYKEQRDRYRIVGFLVDASNETGSSPGEDDKYVVVYQPENDPTRQYSRPYAEFTEMVPLGHELETVPRFEKVG